MIKISISMPEELLNVVDLIAKKRYEDRSTAVRQLLSEAMKEEILGMCSRGKLTQREAANNLRMSIWELHDLAGEYGIPLSDYPVDEARKRVERVRARVIKGTA